MEITLKNLKINYITEGEGTPVVLLHGWGSSADNWRSVINSLGTVCKFYALDFPGCGKSETMQEPWVLDDYCDLVVDFIDAMGLSDPILIGHSHGGRVTIKLCADGRVNPKKIVLIDSAGLIPKKSLKQKLRARTFKSIRTTLELPLLKKPCAPLLEKARRYFGSADYNAAPPVLRKTLVNLVNTDLRDRLPDIKASSLLIWGDKDTATPLSDAKIIESLIPDAGLCVLEGCGHFSYAENPYRANAILNSFLR